jgi:hypothetical protein
MNDILRPDHGVDVPWPFSRDDDRLRDPSLIPGRDHQGEPVEKVLREALSKSATAAPAAPGPVEAEGLAWSRRLRGTRDAWAEGLRCTVRDSPLAALAVALAAGSLLGRMLGSQR